MLIEKFEEWKGQQVDREQFRQFFDIWINEMMLGKDSPTEEFAWQLYQVQVCMDGILEDIEEITIPKPKCKPKAK